MSDSGGKETAGPLTKAIRGFGMLSILALVAGVGLFMITSYDVPGSAVTDIGPPIPPEVQIYAGMALRAENDGEWFRAHVVSTTNDTIRVHYDEWDSRYDRDVTRSQLRFAPEHQIDGKFPDGRK